MRRLLACVVCLAAVAGCQPRQMSLDQLREFQLRAMRSIPPAERTVGGKTMADAFPDLQQREMVRLACVGDLIGLRAALEAGADPNATGLDGVTPLVWVQQCENVAGMAALLDAGADPNADFAGRHAAAVWFAATMPNPEPIKLLLKRGGDPNARGEKWESALWNAFNTGLDWDVWESYEALLDAGAEINVVDRQNTIAEYAVNMNRFDKVAELLERGYATRLEWLGWMCQGELHAGSPKFLPPLVAERDRVVDLLKARGVVFPILDRPSDRPDSSFDPSPT